VRGENEPMRRLALLAYVVIGVIVASRHDYYTGLAIVSRVVSAVVATALWPLILLGASLHLNLGQL
jgi:energy-converting hydrogenase Eha subunit C